MDSELFTSSEANIVGDYTAMVTVRGYQNSGESKEVMWRLDKELGHKEFELMDASEWSGQETYTMKLSDFDLATLEAAEQLGITTSNEVIVTLNGGIVIESNGEVKEIPIDTSATIPLGTTLLEIATTPQEVSDQFVSEEVVIEPVDPKVIAGLVLLFIVSIGMVVFIVFGIENSGNEILQKNRYKKILNSYKNRVVALRNEVNGEQDKIYPIQTFEELVKLSDDLRRPIFYVSDGEEIVKNNRFFVLDDHNRYVCQMVD